MSAGSNSARAGGSPSCGSRLGTIISGYAAAVGTAGFAMIAAYAVFGGLPRTTGWVAYVAGLIFSAIFIAQFIAPFCLVPAALIVWQAERRGIRSPVFYAAAGVVTAVVVIGSFIALTVLGNGSSGVNVTEWMRTSAIFGLPGLCAGLAYWAVAGRKAGVC